MVAELVSFFFSSLSGRNRGMEGDVGLPMIDAEFLFSLPSPPVVERLEPLPQK